MFELLEQRALLTGNTYSPDPAFIDSNVTTDDNLRTAIYNANQDTGTATDTISLRAGTYALSLGELDITNTAHTLIIEGTGAIPSDTIIDQLSLDRVFQVASGVTVEFKDLEITGGDAQDDGNGGTTESDGGGIWAPETSRSTTSSSRGTRHWRPPRAARPTAAAFTPPAR